MRFNHLFSRSRTAGDGRDSEGTGRDREETGKGAGRDSGKNRAGIRRDSKDTGTMRGQAGTGKDREVTGKEGKA